MKDVENLFKRLGTRSEYKDFGTGVLDDVRKKWPLLSDVSDAERVRSRQAVPNAPAPSADFMKEPVQATGKLAEAESKLPVRAFVSRKGAQQESVRDLFKTIGKSPRLTPASSADQAPGRPKTLFDGSKLNLGKKS